MKFFSWTFGFIMIVYFINNQSVNRKKLIEGEYSIDKYIGITVLILKTQPMTIKLWTISWGDVYLILYVPHSITTFCNEERNGISLAQAK